MGDFSLKPFRNAVKIVTKYVGEVNVNERGVFLCPYAGEIGRFIAYPTLLFNSPGSFIVKAGQISDINKLKASSTECSVDDDSVVLSDNIGNVVRFPKAVHDYQYPSRVNHIWNNMGKPSFTPVTDDILRNLQNKKLVDIPAYFSDGEGGCLNILISGSEFVFNKDFVSLAIAAVDRDARPTATNNGLVVLRIEYEPVIIYMACGVV